MKMTVQIHNRLVALIASRNFYSNPFWTDPTDPVTDPGVRRISDAIRFPDLAVALAPLGVPFWVFSGPSSYGLDRQVRAESKAQYEQFLLHLLRSDPYRHAQILQWHEARRAAEGILRIEEHQRQLLEEQRRLSDDLRQHMQRQEADAARRRPEVIREFWNRRL